MMFKYHIIIFEYGFKFICSLINDADEWQNNHYSFDVRMCFSMIESPV